MPHEVQVKDEGVWGGDHFWRVWILVPRVLEHHWDLELWLQGERTLRQRNGLFKPSSRAWAAFRNF